MTRQEAISRLEGGAPFSELYDEVWENALVMAIEALKSEPFSCSLEEFGECSYRETGCSDCKVKEKIRNAIDNAELIKHGRWLIYNILDYAKRPTGRKVAKCSICGRLTPDFRLITEEPNWNYCPNCGAKMDLDEAKE